MVQKYVPYITTFIIIIFFSCNNSKEDNHNSYKQSYSEDDDHPDCGIEDGTYPASVDYNNSSTGYNATYTLDVVVENCEVTEIDFPKGGYLDDDHIDATPIDENGDASVEDDRGRTFDVHIDKDETEDKPDDN